MKTIKECYAGLKIALRLLHVPRNDHTYAQVRKRELGMKFMSATATVLITTRLEFQDQSTSNISSSTTRELGIHVIQTCSTGAQHNDHSLSSFSAFDVQKEI